jgi:hypothetical protein
MLKLLTVTKCFVRSIRRHHMKESNRPTRKQVVLRADELGLDFLDHESALWLFCSAGKVLAPGDMKLHFVRCEYGKNRSKLMRQALENVHPQFQPEFVPLSKTEAYIDLLEILKSHALENCSEQDCRYCNFRTPLPNSSHVLTELVQFCLQDEFAY